jgi:hypothetical protein
MQVVAALVGALAGFGGAVVVEVVRDHRQHRAELAILRAELGAVYEIIEALLAGVSGGNRPGWGRKFEGRAQVRQLHAFVADGALARRHWLRAVNVDESRGKILTFYVKALAAYDRLESHREIEYSLWMQMNEMMRQDELNELWQELAALKGWCNQAIQAVKNAEAALPVT